MILLREAEILDPKGLSQQCSLKQGSVLWVLVLVAILRVPLWRDVTCVRLG